MASVGSFSVGVERIAGSAGFTTAAMAARCEVHPPFGSAARQYVEAERRRNRTYPPPGYDGQPVLKTGWGTSPVPLRGRG